MSQVLYNYAVSLAGVKESAAAVAMLQELVKVVPTHIPAIRLLHSLLSAAGKHDM
jgi:hypothetical protein